MTGGKADVFKNRIVGYGEEAPDQLLAHPQNWRIHPKYQQDALRGVLTEIGFVQSVIVNKRTGNLCDGHMRVMVAMREGVEKIPVVYVDLTVEEENVVLASMDPIGAMAKVDKEKYDELISGVQANDGNLADLLIAMQQAGPFGKQLESILDKGELAPVEGPGTREVAFQAAQHTCPKCGHTW